MQAHVRGLPKPSGLGPGGRWDLVTRPVFVLSVTRPTYDATSMLYCPCATNTYLIDVGRFPVAVRVRQANACAQH